MYKRAYFLCCATYHLAVSLYYTMMVDWKNTETVLVWQNNTNVEVDDDLLNQTFDEVIRVRGKELVTYPFLEQQRYKIVNAGWLFPFSEVGRKLKQLPSGNIVFLFNDVARLTDKITYEFGKREGNEIILVDEGLGTYVFFPKKQKIRTKIGNFICGQHTEIYLGGNKYINDVIARFPEQLADAQKGNRRIIRQNNIFANKKWVSLMNSAYPFHISERKKDLPILLWIGQPLSRFITADSENHILDQVFNLLSTKYYVLIKPHPQESSDKYEIYMEKYGVAILTQGKESWVPVELILNSIEPEVVCSPLSSALLGMNPDIKSIYLYPMFDLKNIDETIKRIIENKENTFVANNMHELETILSNSVGTPYKADEVSNDDIEFINQLLS